MNYGVAITALLLALLLRWLLDQLMHNSFPLVTLFGAIAIAVWHPSPSLPPCSSRLSATLLALTCSLNLVAGSAWLKPRISSDYSLTSPLLQSLLGSGRPCAYRSVVPMIPKTLLDRLPGPWSLKQTTNSRSLGFRTDASPHHWIRPTTVGNRMLP
jgi:hypothetical protein